MSEQELHFDFTRAATRKVFFGSVVQELDDAAKAKVAQAVDDTSIPQSAHLHNLDDVCRAIDGSVVSGTAKEQAKGVYRILAQAEAQVHGCPVEETHFHEVGSGMTCREILGICVAIEQLAPTRITATPVQTGSGKVECSHGILDIPAPATAAILEKYGIPCVEEKFEGELCTPTSAALIAHYVEEFI